MQKHLFEIPSLRPIMVLGLETSAAQKNKTLQLIINSSDLVPIKD